MGKPLPDDAFAILSPNVYQHCSSELVHTNDSCEVYSCLFHPFESYPCNHPLRQILKSSSILSINLSKHSGLHSLLPVNQPSVKPPSICNPFLKAILLTSGASGSRHTSSFWTPCPQLPPTASFHSAQLTNYVTNSLLSSPINLKTVNGDGHF